MKIFVGGGSQLPFAMKKFYKNASPLALFVLSTISLFVFLYGFFPLQHPFQTSDPETATGAEFGFTPGKKFHKMVLMVVDAIRYDFVLPNRLRNDRHMSFTTTSIIEKKSCLIKVKAQAPTVTMPRVKAITSGVNPTYFDVISNFMSSEFKLDNFVSQAVRNNLKIVFYGDETWLKLFPNKFMRSEGTTSFFVSDFTEVDGNVTRNLDYEFKRNDWDFMILHYLGLDHIGHMEGPKSPLIGSKLEKMDFIIAKISSHLKEMEKRGLKTLFLVTSDHGMKDTGGHGGTTKAEVMIPLVSVGRPCNYIRGWPRDYVAEQIDIAPTVSTAFGLPIPKNSAGKIIPALLSGMDVKTIMTLMEMNKKSLKAQLRYKGFDEDLKVTDKELKDMNVHERIDVYFKELSYFSDRLNTVSGYKPNYLILGITVMWIILTSVSLHFAKFARPRRPSQYFLLLGTFLYGLSLTSTSMIEEEHQTWYFLWTTVCILFIYENLNTREFSLTHVMNILPWVGILITHRILRKLNQTGDKWASLPDIKGYLAENPDHLAMIYFLGLLGLMYCVLTEDSTLNEVINFFTALFMNVCYRLAVSGIKLDFVVSYPKSSGHLECMVFCLLVGTYAYQILSVRKPIHMIWALAASILMKPHNVILVPVEIITSRCIQKLYPRADEIWTNFAHFWMGYVFYFYQGNGNSIANVDISAGFIGQEEYNPVHSFFLIAAHTNTSHILAFLLVRKNLLSICFLRVIPLTIFCSFLMFQLNHLFIWSVLSPKLLYETNFQLIFLILMTLHCCCLKYPKRQSRRKRRVSASP